MASKRLKVTLIRSSIGRKPKHRATLVALGLRRLHRSIVVENNPSMLGMINKVGYLLKVEECDE